MKTKSFGLFLTILSAFASCEIVLPETAGGSLSLEFSDQAYHLTKNVVELPDTNDFILSLADKKGNEIYKGKYCDASEAFTLKAGTYTVEVVSSAFSVPKFSSPQYGDRQTVVVGAGENVHLELLCRQLNAGMRLKIEEDFIKEYPNSTLHLKSKEGSLLYGYRESRIAYFNPGIVSLVLSESGNDQTLMDRVLESRQILTVNISVPEKNSQKNGVSISVDTARVWTEENYVIGDSSSDKGGEKNEAMDVKTARANAGNEDVWVYGYIVGGDLTSSNASFEAPFKSKTNLLLGARRNSSDKATCLSIQLQKGNIRDDLNLVDHPDMLGTQVFLKGDIVESYYGIAGLQNISEYSIK